MLVRFCSLTVAGFLGACDWLLKLGYIIAYVSAGAKMQPVSILDTEKLIVETKATSSLMHDGLDE